MNEYEKDLNKKNIKIIAGVDEVGRGPLAGPVVAACVVLPVNFSLPGINDSKKLSVKKRNEYAKEIKKNALAYAIVEVSSLQIDRLNIYQATKKAMVKAIVKVNQKINVEHVLIDAMPLDLEIPHTSIIKGDQKSISIAAASILAKVYRDNLMIKLDERYPQYGFKDHKGYPTKKHLQNLKKYGIIKEYRMSYQPVKEVLDGN